MKKVLLNCLPPTAVYKPGYSLSVIKSFLVQNGYEASIKYWNLFLKDIISAFWFNEMESINLPWLFKDLMPFFNYIAYDRQDEYVLKNIHDFLKRYFPERSIRKHMQETAATLETVILQEFQHMKIEDYDFVYVQSKFYKYELISTGVFCKILKKNYPTITTIIEAQEFPRKAMALMDSFDCYDYATWGEYELPLLSLLNTLCNDNPALSRVPNIVYRNKEQKPQYSQQRLNEFIELNDAPFADFSDYIAQSDVPIPQIIFPLEGGRGCHWNRCSFCYMNDGYVYRKKTPQRLISEIRHYMDIYGAQFFYFIDNDMIGHNPNDFKQLLSGLKKIRKLHTLKFEFGEVIAKNADADIIQAISEAGFLEIQIGYEFASDKALKLINKKSRFAHLILVSKWSLYYGMKMSPQNILRSMPFETEAIILDNILFLYFLRFLLSNEGFSHSLRELCVVSTSRYYKPLLESGKLQLWDSTPMQEFMPLDLIKPDYKYDVFLMQISKNNPLWRLFKITERFYQETQYSYQLREVDGVLIYSEFVNGKIFREKSLSAEEFEILSICDRKVISLSELHLQMKIEHTIDNIKEIIKTLMGIGIIYASDDYEQIVSIIIMSDNI